MIRAITWNIIRNSIRPLSITPTSMGNFEKNKSEIDMKDDQNYNCDQILSSRCKSLSP